MKTKRILMLIGSVCLAVMLLVPLAVSCGPAMPEEAAAEIAAVESKLAAEKAKVTGLEDEIADLEDEIAGLRAPGEQLKWRFQHGWGAAESYFFEQYADIVRDMSDGRIDMSVYFADELVPMGEIMNALKVGTIDISFFSACLFEGVVPAAIITSVPFLWQNLDEFIGVYYQMGLEEEYRRGFKEKFDIHLIALIPDDHAGMLWADEFSTLADLSGRKANFFGSMSWVMSQYGVSSTYFDPGDLYTSLATGVIDGVSWGGAKGMLDMGFPEIAKYWGMPYLVNTFEVSYWMDSEKWEALPSELQAVLTQAGYANGLYIRSVYAASEKTAFSQAAEEWGTEVVTFPEEDVQKLVATSLEYLLTVVKEEYPEAARAVDIVVNALRTFGRIE